MDKNISFKFTYTSLVSPVSNSILSSAEVKFISPISVSVTLFVVSAYLLYLIAYSLFPNPNSPQ